MIAQWPRCCRRTRGSTSRSSTATARGSSTTQGNRYLDLFAGIAVVGLGHRHPAPTAAAHAQLDRLWHVSNLYWTTPMQELAAKLSDRFGGASAFFCNSGAESVEAALKWARKATGRTEVVALDGSFHGRTFGALSVTGQPAKRAAFEPLVPGARFGLEHVGPDTAAILLEPVQGEGGVHPLSPEFLAEARALADEHGALLIFDEVQTGVGRSGSFFAWQELGVQPGRGHAREGSRERPADRRAARLRRRADRLRAGRPRLDVRRQPGRVRSRVRGASTRSTTSCSPTSTTCPRTCATGSPSSARCAGSGSCSRSSSTAPPRRSSKPRSRTGSSIGSAGERVLRLTPPLTLSLDEAALALSLLEGALA